MYIPRIIVPYPSSSVIMVFISRCYIPAFSGFEIPLSTESHFLHKILYCSVCGVLFRISVQLLGMFMHGLIESPGPVNFLPIFLLIPARIHMIHRIVRAVRIQIPLVAVLDLSPVGVLGQEVGGFRVVVSGIKVIQPGDLVVDTTAVCVLSSTFPQFQLRKFPSFGLGNSPVSARPY